MQAPLIQILFQVASVLVMAMFGFDLGRGLQTGRMRVRFGRLLSGVADRVAAPRTFWTYAAVNLGLIAFLAFILYRSVTGGV